MPVTLPVEVWRFILNIAIRDVDEDAFKTRWDSDPDDRLWKGWTKTSYDDQDQETAILYKSRVEMGQNIIRVCRVWHSIGVELVHEIIQLVGWYSDQRLAAILSSFEASTSSDPVGRGYGRWTKRIDFDVMLFAAEGTEDHFCKLLSLCHNLTTLICRARRDSTSVPSQIHLRIVQLLESRFPNTFRRLDWQASIDFTIDSSPLPIAPTLPLTSLDIEARILPPQIARELVTTLILRPPYGAPPDALSPEWNFPNLQHLALVYIGDRDVEPMTPFVRQHANTLQSLALRSRYDNRTICVDISDLIHSATQLKALVIRDVDMVMLYPPAIFHTITHVGIIGIENPYPAAATPGPASALKHGLFPSLKCLQLLELEAPIGSYHPYGVVLGECEGLGITVRQVVDRS